MAIRKTESRPALNREPVRFKESTTQKSEAEVLHSRLQSTDEELLLDDDDFGGDPYNSTGRFTMLQEAASKK